MPGIAQDILMGSPTVPSSLVGWPGFAGFNRVRLKSLLVPHSLLSQVLVSEKHLAPRIPSQGYFQRIQPMTIGCNELYRDLGERRCLLQKRKEQNGDDREVEMATALTMGNFAPHNARVTQRSKIRNRMVGRNLWVPAHLGHKSSKGSKITNSYS